MYPRCDLLRNNVACWVDDHLYALIAREAFKHDMSISEWMRQTAMLRVYDL